MISCLMRPFGSAVFNEDIDGEPVNVLIVPKVFIKSISREYDVLGGAFRDISLRDIRNGGLHVCNCVTEHSKRVPRDRPFALSFVRANHPSIVYL